jgi:hypothetical protein
MICFVNENYVQQSSTTTKIKLNTLWNNQQTYPHISRYDPWNSTFESKTWNDFVSNIMFNVIKSLSNLIILKLSRLKIHNLNIDWLGGKIYSKIDQHPKWKPIWLIFIELLFFTSNRKIINWRQKMQMHFHHNIKISRTYLKEWMQTYYRNINHTIMNGITKNIQPPFEPIYIFFNELANYEWKSCNNFHITFKITYMHIIIFSEEENMGFFIRVWIIVATTKSP